MTHDELMDKVDDLDCAGMVYDISVKALRAVVELHKPREEVIGMGVTFEGVTTSLSTHLRCGCGELYPCANIKAIEKELK